MKLPPLTMVLFLFLAPAAHSSHRQRRTLSATTKKPASLAGFRYLLLSLAHLNGSFLPRPSFSLASLQTQLFIQTPSSLNPA